MLKEAAQAVTQKTGLQVTDQPILVYGEFLESSTALTHPFWEVKTTDGQVYYVFFVTAMSEGDQQVETTVNILSQAEVHPLRCLDIEQGHRSKNFQDIPKKGQYCSLWVSQAESVIRPSRRNWNIQVELSN